MSQTPPPPAPMPPPGGSYGPGYPIVAPPMLPTHERASLSLGLGIIGLLGAFVCGVGLLASPFALACGISARRAIRAEPGRWGGDGMALAGIVLGVIGIVMLVLAILALMAIGILIMAGVIQATSTGGIAT